MLGFDKLASNARRFRMLMGMSLQEFDLLLTKMEKAYPEEERKRLSKRLRQREIGAGRRFALVCGIGRCCSCSTTGHTLPRMWLQRFLESVRPPYRAP